MKKCRIALVLTAVLSLITTTGCFDQVKLEDNSKRVKTLFYNPDGKQNDENTSWGETLDMDGDGRTEDILISSSGNSPYQIDVSIGEQTLYDVCGSFDPYGIRAVYITDIDETDNAREVVLFTLCGSDDPMLQIFRYKNGEIETMCFSSEYGDAEHLFVGYVSGFPFEILEDNVISLQTQTRSMGMWDVKQTYKTTDNHKFKPVKQKKYNVVQGTENYTDKDGYALVKEEISLVDEEIIEAGEYIRVIADDGNDNITLEVKGGKTHKLNLGDFERQYLIQCSDLFILAG